MYCCPNCFSDHFLKQKIVDFPDNHGTCDFCNLEDTPLLIPNRFGDNLDSLVDLYLVSQDGQSLTNLIQKDWRVFNFDDSDIIDKLFKSIVEDHSFEDLCYRPKFVKDRTVIEHWEIFREELKHQNRFFPSTAPNQEHLSSFTDYIASTILSKSQSFFRARIDISNKGIPVENMGKPPKDRVGNGRANPIGIPYLYLASSIKTAISEIRGHKGEQITIAEYELGENLSLADLRNPIDKISPFIIEEKALEFIYQNMPFLMFLGKELSKPIIPREANLEYLPTQYLCEMIKGLNFDGIIFRSSVSEGDNYVLFSDNKLNIIKTFQYEITDTNIKSKEVM
jgi:hypothetical protein